VRFTGSHGGECEDDSLVGYCAVKFTDFSDVLTASTFRAMSLHIEQTYRLKRNTHVCGDLAFVFACALSVKTESQYNI
jgi:hypothetical protein